MNRLLSLPLLLLTACSSAQRGGSEAADIRALVKVKPVVVGTVERTVELTATVEAGRSLDMLPDVPGKIKDLPVKVGDEVPRGGVVGKVGATKAAPAAPPPPASTQ